MAEFVLLLFSVLFCVGAISVIYPLRFLRVKTRMRGLGLAFVSATIVIISLTYIDPSTQPRRPTGQSGNVLTMRSDQADVRLPDLPEDEVTFIEVVRDSLSIYEVGSNDMAKGAARPQRAQSLCAILRSMEVRDWIGYVSTLSTNNEGRGVLALTLPDSSASVTTWNNAMSDIFHKTLIEPGSPVHNAASILERGQAVSFSGTFFRNDEDCVDEQSLSLSGSMDSPEFTFRFSAIRPL